MYKQTVNVGEVSKFHKSFIETAIGEILDMNRNTEPTEFKKNYPHYNFNDDTSMYGSTRFDTSFKHHGSEELVPSNYGRARVCLPSRPKKVIAVPKQVIKEEECGCYELPKPVILKPRPYTSKPETVELSYCEPVSTITDNVVTA